MLAANCMRARMSASIQPAFQHFASDPARRAAAHHRATPPSCRAPRTCRPTGWIWACRLALTGPQRPARVAPMSERLDLEGRHIVLGLSGGIACYKAAELTRELIMAGATVQVVMT